MDNIDLIVNYINKRIEDHNYIINSTKDKNKTYMQQYSREEFKMLLSYITRTLLKNQL